MDNVSVIIRFDLDKDLVRVWVNGYISIGKRSQKMAADDGFRVVSCENCACMDQAAETPS